MYGNGLESSNEPDAQQDVPRGAGPARDAGGRADGCPEVRWVGQQHLMCGYCGRAATGEHSAGGRGPAPDGGPAAAPAAAVDPARAVTLPQRPRDQVVRVGPKRQAEVAATVARAA